MPAVAASSTMVPLENLLAAVVMLLVTRARMWPVIDGNLKVAIDAMSVIAVATEVGGVNVPWTRTVWLLIVATTGDARDTSGSEQSKLPTVRLASDLS